VWNRSSRFNTATGVGGYIGAIALITAVVLSVAVAAAPRGGIAGLRLAVLALLGLIPSIDAAVALVNRAAMMRFGATTLPALRCAAASHHVCGRW